MMQTYFPYGASTQPQPGFFEIQSYLLWVKSINTSLITQYESRIQKLKTTLLDPTLKGKERKKYRQRKLRATKARTGCISTLSRIENELAQLNSQINLQPFLPPAPVYPVVVPQFVPPTPIYPSYAQYQLYQPYPTPSLIVPPPLEYRPSRSQSSPGPSSPRWDIPTVESGWILSQQQQGVLDSIDQLYPQGIYQDMPMSPMTCQPSALIEETGPPPIVGWNPHFTFQDGDSQSMPEQIADTGIQYVEGQISQTI